MKTKNKTNVVFILDKSGSMGSVQGATIEGFNSYLNRLKKDKKSDYAVSLTLFDTSFTKLYVHTPIKEVKELNNDSYRPDGGTALYDALGQTLAEDSGEGKTLYVIITDGEENSSRIWQKAQIQALIKAKAEKHTFVYLGANQDSWANGQSLGIPHMNISNFHSTGNGMRTAFAMMATNTMNFSASASLNTKDFLSKTDQNNLSSTK